MKKLFTFALLLMLAGLQAAMAQKVVIKLSGSEPVKYDISQLEYIAFEEGEPVNNEGHEYVEIGGLKWATMNVGATTVAGSYETCCGDYFAWGETETRYETMTRTGAYQATFTWKEGYEGGGYSSSNNPTYTGTILDTDHDAARKVWGDEWRTPTAADFLTLAKACTGSDIYVVELINTIDCGGIYWLSESQMIEPAYTGVSGILFVSASDISKRVFFPAAGVVYGTYLHGSTNGFYWSSSLDTSNTSYANSLWFHSSLVNASYPTRRYRGCTVRPVRD